MTNRKLIGAISTMVIAICLMLTGCGGSAYAVTLEHTGDMVTLLSGKGIKYDSKTAVFTAEDGTKATFLVYTADEMDNVTDAIVRQAAAGATFKDVDWVKDSDGDEEMVFVETAGDGSAIVTEAVGYLKDSNTGFVLHIDKECNTDIFKDIDVSLKKANSVKADHGDEVHELYEFIKSM